MAKKKLNKRALLFGYESIVCVVLCLISVFLFIFISEMVFGNKVDSFDLRIINYFQENLTSFHTRFMIFASAFGSLIFFFALSSVFATYLYLKNKIDAFIFIVIIYSAVVINVMLKLFYERPRPEINPLVIENSYSYPSFHAMGSLVLYAAITYFVYRETKNKLLTLTLTVLFGIIVFFIGISRIYLGVHYPSDVIAGWLAGIIWLLVVLFFQRTILFENLYNKAIGKR